MLLRVESTLILAGLLFGGAMATEAAVIRVPADQPTIQAAINAAVDGDTIQVAPGTYVENLNFLSKAIRVSSGQGPQVTVIDGNQAGPVVAAFDMGVYESPSVDRIPPVTTATVMPLPNSAGWNRGAVSVTFNASDNPGGSGVQSIRYWITGVPGSTTVSGSSASVSITAEGTTTVWYSATDNAGNVETAKSLDVKIDKTNPVISGMPTPGCTLTPAKHQLVQVATVTSSDSLSGIASLSVTATSSEPDAGTGGGDVAGDIVIKGGTVQLRAERSPSGKGRIYTITATAMDAAGNSVTATAACSVPR